jgi:hypothetical protein
MSLKRAYVIIVLSFAWLIGWVIVGMMAGPLFGGAGAQGMTFVIAVTGCEVGLIIGVCEVALAKGYSIVLGIVLGFSGFLGLLIVELLPNRWESPH